MTALSTWDVENARAHRQSEHVEKTRYFAPITFRGKEGLVLEEIVGVER